MFQLDGYRKLLLNRTTVSQPVIDYIENCLNSNNDDIQHAFHKIMVLHWSHKEVDLFNMISEYFGGFVLPVQSQTLNIISTFYTNNLSLILKIIKMDFIFPYNTNMCNIDILFNDKTSTELFGSKISMDEIVTGAVCKRFNEKFELDLSDFCNDPEFKQNYINFYKFGLLCYFKTLMTRMGQDTRLLKLSNNNLSQVPQELLNYFMKGNLIAIDLSNNMFRSLAELQRVNSRIEKLWLEGNPLCDEIEPVPYMKQLILKFPRLTELDGIRLNQHGILMPFNRNFLVTPNKKTKVIVEKFVTLYFTYYDALPRDKNKLMMFYDEDVHLSLSVYIPELEMKLWPSVYKKLARNMLTTNPNSFRKRKSVLNLLQLLPKSTHDLTSFSVDVLMHTKKHLLMVVDGVYKEINQANKNGRYMSFRRTFLFLINSSMNNVTSTYLIKNEVFTISPATRNQIKYFKDPVRNLNTFALVNPERADIEALCSIFMHITQLKNMEICERRLKACNWDIKLALLMFRQDVQNNEINSTKLMDHDDFSDTSSLLDDEID